MKLRTRVVPLAFTGAGAAASVAAIRAISLSRKALAMARAAPLSDSCGDDRAARSQRPSIIAATANASRLASAAGTICFRP